VPTPAEEDRAARLWRVRMRVTWVKGKEGCRGIAAVLVSTKVEGGNGGEARMRVRREVTRVVIRGYLLSR
jgi:hypothetical protein